MKTAMFRTSERIAPLATPPDVNLDDSSLRLLAEALGPLSQCACAYNRDGVCLFGNRGLALWLGIHEEDLVGMSVCEIWPDGFASRELADIRRVLEQGRIEQLEMRPARGGPLNVRAVKYKWCAGEGKVVVVVVFEEATLGTCVDQPEQLGWLAMGIVHDFNNILTMIRGEVDLLGMDHLEDPERLISLDRLLDHATQLPRQLLSFARHESLPHQTIDLHALLHNLDDLLRAKRARGISLDLRLQPGPAWVLADPVQLTQVFLNLANNAIEAMGGKGILMIETRREGQAIQVAFEDTGPGIPVEALTRIFEPLYSRRVGGTGLGLVIAREIIRRHGGTIRCISPSGRGARFVLELPLTGVYEESMNSLEPRQAILVVEPEVEIARLVSVILQKAGYVVSTRATLPHPGDGGATPDLVVVDSAVLDERGAAILEEWLHQNPNTRLLLTSAGAEATLTPYCQNRMRGTLCKPYSTGVIQTGIRRALEKR